jgi:hypothetical protein
MNLTKKQIDAIREHTPPELKGTHQSIYADLGSYWKAGANWSYRAGWTRDGNLVVTVFGEVI